MNLYSIFPLISFIFNLFLWTYIFAQKEKTAAKTAYLLFIGACFIWALSDFIIWNMKDAELIHTSLKISSTVWLSITFLYLNFSYQIINRKIDLIYKILLVLTILFAIISVSTNLIVKGADILYWGALVQPGKLYNITMITTVLIPGVFALFIIFKEILKVNTKRKMELTLFLIGIFLTFTTATSINIVAAILLKQKSVPSLGSTLVTIQAIFVFIASTKYKFLSISVDEIAFEIFKKSTDGYILTDNKEVVIEINSSALSMLNIDRPIAINQPIESMLPFAHKHNLNSHEIKLKSSTGEITALVSSNDFFTNNNYSGNLVTIKNITEHIDSLKIKEENEFLENKIKESHKEKMAALGELAGGMVHNVNNLLGGISGYAAVLKQRVPKEEKLVRPIENIETIIEDAATMTRHLLAFSRNDFNDFTNFNMHESLLKVTDILKHTLTKSITITTVLNAPETIVSGNSAQIENAIINMGINARDAMPKGGELTFATRNSFNKTDNTTYIEIDISDNGIGMAQEIAEKIFEPFFTTKKKGAGTGLGLSSSYGIIESHHGKILVNSSIGKGTTFTLKLPVFS
ncbi:MAG: hypothetical protein JXR91_12450 [Deltaproteobacteria bacterium]|nr:hypothetical protein [Deltaproteobacteria bacterium]